MAVLKARQRQRQPGQWRHGAQHLEDRIEAAHGPIRLADQHAEADPGDHRQQIADRHPFEAGQQLPGQAHVIAAVVVERIDDQLPGFRDHLRRRWQRGIGTGAEHLPDHPEHQQDHQRWHQLLHRVAAATLHQGSGSGWADNGHRLGAGGLQFDVGIHGLFLAGCGYQAMALMVRLSR